MFDSEFQKEGLSFLSYSMDGPLLKFLNFGLDFWISEFWPDFWISVGISGFLVGFLGHCTGFP